MRLCLVRGCLFAHRVTFALREKRLAFEPIFFEYAARPDEIKALGPQARSPTLFDGATCVWDFRLVLEYLEERYPESAALAARSR
jgi:glutathione S-transferase